MHDNLAGLILFAFVGAFTPGPNNLMVMASGTIFGFRPTIPHILGVTVGFALMLVAFGLGLASFFQAFPAVHYWVRIAGAAYLLYLAWRIATAGSPTADESVRRPLSFLEAALFQWLNIKALTLAVGVVTAFTTVGGNLLFELALIVTIFTAATLATLVTWCLFGMGIKRLLSSSRALRITNLVLAALLALSVVTLFM
ncbi:MAG TPA: LysE family translocator [Xanthobacteraceae bacterium]|nr:LysE family translocator [Xanthobacteraceae bacterium]